MPKDYPSKWLRFEVAGNLVVTTIWHVITKESNTKIGEIHWYSPWRKYAFFPEYNTIWEPTCLLDVVGFLKQAMDERRAARKEKHAN